MARYIDAEALTAEFKRLTLGENSLVERIFADGVYAVIDTFPTADVAPKSEVDKWYHEYHAIKDELKQEKMYHRETEKLVDKYCTELEKAKAEVERWRRNLEAVLDEIPETKRELASEIFAEIEKLHLHITNDFDLRRYEQLKKKHTEETK